MFKRAYTFDDVLLTPQYSTLKTRKGIDTSTELVSGLRLKTPIVASNMDTVCESDMAIRMAEIGGIGIIHRYLSVEDQVAEVERVKTHLNFILSNPYTIHLHNSLEEAVDIMVEQNVSSLLVINSKSQFSGILGLKDATYVPGTLDNYKVTDAMVALEDVITVSPTVTKSEALNLMQNQRIGKLPVLNDLIRAGVDVLVLDIAHGHSIMSIEALKAIKAEYEIPVIAGNVATAQGAIELAQAGADGIKVGVGPGSICTTRIVTGHGVPQLTAILDACNSVDVPIIADGGIRKSGDIVKALAAGASTVMLGSLLAGTDESPGGVITRDGSRYKMIRGMASYGAALGRSKRAGDDVSEATPEGVEALIPYRGSVDEIITNLMGGVRSGFSYSGATCLAELWQNAEFVEISPAGLIESRHHDVKAL